MVRRVGGDSMDFVYVAGVLACLAPGRGLVRLCEEVG
jgi:hypothetical protein